MFRSVFAKSKVYLGWGVFFACFNLVLPLSADARSSPSSGHGCSRSLAIHAIGLAEQKLLATASEEFDKAISLAPNDEELLISKAYTLYGGRRDCVKENQLYSKALEINPLNTDALGLRGISYERMNDYRAAIQDFDRAIKIAPNDARLYGARAFGLRRLGRYKESVCDYDQAISLNPSNAFFLNDRAYTKVSLGLNLEGLTDIDKAIALNPGVAEFHETRGMLLGGLSRFDESIQAYNCAQRLGSMQVFCARADVKMSAGHYHDALADWQIEADRYPKDLFFIAKRGECFLKMQEWDKALIELNRSIELDLPFSYQWRAEALYHLARYDEALKDYSNASTFFENFKAQPSCQHAQILLERARTLEKLGKFKSALKELARALTTDSSNREIYFEFFNLAQGYSMSISRTITFAMEVLLSLFIHFFMRRRIRRLF